MNIETLLYIYLFVCASMIVFNIITAIVLRGIDRRTVRTSEKFKKQVAYQLGRLWRAEETDALGRTAVEESHKRYLQKKLKRVGNMIAFDRMLETAYIEDPRVIKAYLSDLDSVFIYLTASYLRKSRIEAAYFPYIIKKYRLISHRPFPSIVGSLLQLLREPSIYCRENAMQALYTTGDPDCIMEALGIIDKSELFFHGKLLSDGLLNFSGSTRALNDRIIEKFSDFSTDMRIALLNYLRFSSGEYREFALGLLSDEKQNAEIRYACIRYLGKYPLDAAYPLICSFAVGSSSEKWEYAAIASSALGSYPGEKTVALLKSNLYSHNWYIRFNSAESLERLGVTYENLADIIDGNDRYASEILQYRFERRSAVHSAKAEDGKTGAEAGNAPESSSIKAGDTPAIEVGSTQKGTSIETGNIPKDISSEYENPSNSSPAYGGGEDAKKEKEKDLC